MFLYVSLCKPTQTRNEVSYNITENRFETVVTSRLAVVKFDIDLLKSVLTVWGNRSIAQRLVTLISQASKNQIIIEDYVVDFPKMVSRISDMDMLILSKMKLENVMIDSGISASCNVSLVNIEGANSLVKKYCDNISQLSIILGDRLSDSSVSLTFFSSGSIVVYKDRDNIPEEILTQIQEIAMGRGDL